MDVLIGSPNLFIISNNEYNHYLTYNDYQNIVLFGMNNANNISFVLEINEDQDITYLFYQLYNYNPLKSEQVYKYIRLSHVITLSTALQLHVPYPTTPLQVP